MSSISARGTLACRLSGGMSIKGTLSGGGSISGTMSVGGIVMSRFPDYAGSTEMTPKFGTAQAFATKDTVVHENLLVKPIALLEVSNAAGGMTITIGE